MAEVLGVIGGVASLVALAQETFQACNKLAKFVKLYKNASSDISGLCDELSDLSQTISLVQVALQTSRDLSVPDEDAAIGIERTLAGLQKDLDAIEKTITASQHQPTSRKNAKARLKWAFKRTDIISAMTTIGRKKQTLLTKLSLMHMNQLKAGVAFTNVYGSKLDQVTSCLESLTIRVDKSSRESCKEVQRCLEPSFASLEDLVRKNVQQGISASPRNDGLTTIYVERLADQISKTLIQKNPEHFKSPVSSANDSAVEAEGIKVYEQAVTQQYSRANASRIAISRHTVSQKFGCIFGKLEYRYYTSRVPLLTSEEDLSMETNMTELTFTLVPWLQIWLGRGSIVSQMTNWYQGFTFSISLPRVVDDSDPAQRLIWGAVQAGDIVTLQESFRKRLAYPTDVNVQGQSLLSFAASWSQIDICRLLLQHGAGVGINASASDLGWSPIFYALKGSRNYPKHDLLRLFLNYGADPTLVDGFGWDAVTASLLETSNRVQPCDAEQDSIFKFFIKSDMPCDMHQRNVHGHSLLMVIYDKPLSVYQDLLELGADAKAIDYAGNTVLHHYFLGFRYIFDCNEKVSKCPDILKALILAGADHRHVNSHGRLAPEMIFESRHRMSYPLSIQFPLARCVWHEALRRSGLDTAGDVFIESYSTPYVYYDRRPYCCLFNWPSFSTKQDRIHLEIDAFEDHIIAVFECWITSQKMMAPFLPKPWLAWHAHRVGKVRDSLSKFKSRKTYLDRAGRTDVRLFWEQPRPQSKVEPQEWSKQQNSRQECVGDTFDGTTAKKDVPEVCECCQKGIKERLARWDLWDDWEDWETDDFWDYWDYWGMPSKETVRFNTQREGHMDMNTQHEQETDSDSKSEEDYFSAEEA